MNNPAVNKRWIRPLPERLVNKIAAGEVIERPSAVLKELVENALDAGSTRIEIVVEKSGTKSITVIDNGCGISSEQVEIAFSRHATSKISDFDDLENLLTFGFRGEALPSIGSVAKVRMVTKTADEDTGTELIIEGGVLQSVKPTAAPNGTRVEVRDLFYNTPARRKFLKAETTEARHLNRNAVAMALGAPGVSMTYQINGRKQYNLDAKSINLKDRVAALLNSNDSDSLVEIDSDTGIMKVSGFITLPGKFRQNRNGLFLFINDRYISSTTMIHAITSGYGELLPGGKYPVGAVFIQVDPDRVDVNVHPTKAEVRLSEERPMHDMLYQAVKRVIRGTGEIPSHSIPISSNSGRNGMTMSEAVSRLREYNPSDYKSVQTDMEQLYKREETPMVTPNERVKDVIDDGRTIKPQAGSDEADAAGLIYLGQVAELYLIFKTRDRLMIVDQHTAHERILYEENIRSIQNGKAVSQNLLFPINIELSPDRFALFEEAHDILKAAGFEAEPFGARTVLINAVPTSLSKKSPEKIFHGIIEDVEELKEAGFDMRKAVAQSVACRSAIMAGDRLTKEEALSLFERLQKCENKHSCPHGRPIVLKISKDELDIKFGRK